MNAKNNNDIRSEKLKSAAIDILWIGGFSCLVYVALYIIGGY